MKLLLENWRGYIKEQEETNEILGMGKKYIDFETEHLDAIQQIPIAIDHAVRGLEHDGYPQEFYKEYLEKLIKKYENEVDPMLSRLMVAKGQIDKASRTIDPFVAKAVSHYLPDEVPSWENDSDLIRQLIELVLNMRNKILGAYKRYRNKVSNMPPYKPKPGMHDLENLMGQAKVREELKEGEPKKGTGKKPKGSSRRLYTDEDPSDTVSVKFATVQDIKDTLSKASFKSKSHKRQSQIINLIHQRARAAYQNAKDPKVKARLKKSYDYAKQRKEASKRKTQRMNKSKKTEK
tara:strand:- start:2340 stop:3215 length:876 start_codon:yes stop_codon:yes gene_type:complete